MERVVAADETTCVTERRVTDGPHLADGLLWEGALIEGLAQTAAILNARHDGARDERVQRGMLVGVRRFSVHRAPRVGETVTFRVELVRRLSPATLMQGTARAGGELLAEGELKFWVETPS